MAACWCWRESCPTRSELKSGEAYNREVAQRRQAEASLEFERSLLHTLMNHLPDAIYFKDRDGRFLRVSNALADKFGLPDPKAAVGKSDADFFTAEHAVNRLQWTNRRSSNRDSRW